MQDPHIVALHYRVQTDETVTYDNPPPVEWPTSVFDMQLDTGEAVFIMKEHYASEQAARERIEQFLREWDLYMQLERGATEIRFVFERADLVDRNPPPPPRPGDVRIVAVAALATVTAVGTATVHATRRRYPDPPVNFRTSPLVEDLWSLYDRYRHDRERLLPMAYSCLSLLMWEAGGDLKQAAKQYHVSVNVLTKLRTLSSRLGDARTARKFTKDGLFRPPTPEETRWIEEVLKAIIRRVGECAADPNAPLPELTLARFPLLK